MRMKTVVETVTEGPFSELMEKAVTGSKIEFGRHEWDDWNVGPFGLMIERDNEFFLIGEDGSKNSLGRHECDFWNVGPFGLMIERDDEFFLIVIKE